MGARGDRRKEGGDSGGDPPSSTCSHSLSRKSLLKLSPYIDVFDYRMKVVVINRKVEIFGIGHDQIPPWAGVFELRNLLQQLGIKA